MIRSVRPFLLAVLVVPLVSACEFDILGLERDGELRVQILADEQGDAAPGAFLAGRVEYRVRVVARTPGGDVPLTDGVQSGTQAFGAGAGTLSVRALPTTTIEEIRVEFHDVSVVLDDGREIGLEIGRYVVNIAPGAPVVHETPGVEVPAGVRRTLRIDFNSRAWLIERVGRTVPATEFRNRVRISLG